MLDISTVALKIKMNSTKCFHLIKKPLNINIFVSYTFPIFRYLPCHLYPTVEYEAADRLVPLLETGKYADTIFLNSRIYS